MSTVSERIAAEHQAFIAWRPPAYMEPYQREYSNADRPRTALARLLGRIEGLIEGGGLSPESLAEAVATALRVPDEDLVFGRPARGWLGDDLVPHRAVVAG